MSDFYDEENQDIYHIRTHAAGPRGELPLCSSTARAATFSA